ncbi:MAG: GNAT family N-acetyltransferase [Clostridiales bacterium]|nr:GNAT family N-acetyltransferase [Clostridiales bacterium]
MLTITKKFNFITKQKIKALYFRSFPKVERKPFSMINKKVRSKDMSILALFDGKTFVGEMIVIFYKDLVLLDYFAIKPKFQNMGYGTQAIKLLKEKFTGKKIIIEIESPLVYDDEIKKRRKAFYLRNGFSEQGYLIDLFTVQMEVLTIGGKVTFSEYHEIFPNVFNKFVGDNIKFIKNI